MKANRYHLVLVSLWLLCTLNTSYCQTPKHIFSIHTGYSNGRANIRYDFLEPFFETSVKKNIGNTTPDDEYFIGFGYNVRVGQKASVGLNINYSQLQQDFFLPLRSVYFCFDHLLPLYRTASRYHMLQFAPSIDYTLLSHQVLVGISVQSILNISYKKVFESYFPEGRNIELFATEIYPGIFARYHRWRLDVGARALHWKYRDDALYNNGLNPDTYNPLKIRFQVGYILSKK